MATPQKSQRTQVRLGETFTSTEAKNSFGSVLEHVLRTGVVTITKHDKPSAVVLSIEAYEELLAHRTDPLSALRVEFDRRIAEMQTPKAKAGVRALFAASPSALGRAAVKGTRRQRG